jgi:predicted PurR-regulated permease PerM
VRTKENRLTPDVSPLRSNVPLTLVSLAAAVIVIAGLRAAQALVVPFMLALFLAIIVAPLVTWLQGKRVPSAVAVLLVVVVLLAVLTIVGVVLGGTINRFVAAIPQYQARLDALVNSIPGLLERLPMEIEVDDREILGVIDPGSVMSWVGSGLKGLAAILSNTFMIALIVVFMLLEGIWVPTKLRVAFGEDSQAVLQVDHAATQIQRYLALKTGISLATGALVAIWTAVLGLDFAILWGLLAFLLNFIPTIGSLIAAVPAVLLALVQLGPGSALAVGLGFLVVNVTFGNIIEPNVMGRTLGLSTLVVFLSLVFWGWVLGPVGMLLSVPLTMIIKILLESSENTRPIAIMLDNGRAAAARIAQEEAESEAAATGERDG